MIIDGDYEAEPPLREDRYVDANHRDVLIVSRYYKDGRMTVELEGSNLESLSAVEVKLKVVLMRKGMLGMLRSRSQVERAV